MNQPDLAVCFAYYTYRNPNLTLESQKLKFQIVPLQD
jgi:hypothetical protein